MVRSTTASYGKYRSTAHSLVEISPYDLDPFKISYTVFTVPSSQQLAGQHQVKVSLSKTATRQIVIIIVIAATRLAAPRKGNYIGYQLLLPLLLDQEATTRPELYLAHVLYCFGLCASPCRHCPRRYENSSM